MEKEQFGLYISKLRKEKGLTQKELGEKLYLTDKAISKWERGISYPDICMLDILADVLGVSVAELLSCGTNGEDSRLTMSEVNELIENSLKLSEEVMKERRGKTRALFMLCVVIALLIVSILLNIINYNRSHKETCQITSANTEIETLESEEGGDR